MADYVTPAWVKILQSADHVTLEATSKTGHLLMIDFRGKPSRVDIAAGVRSLAGAVFDNEHPGETAALALRYARSIIDDTTLSAVDEAMLIRQNELGMNLFLRKQAA